LKIKSRKYVEVFYDRDLKNWDKAIEQELKRLGIERRHVTVICRPFKRFKSGASNETIFPRNGGNR